MMNEYNYVDGYNEKNEYLIDCDEFPLGKSLELSKLHVSIDDNNKRCDGGSWNSLSDICGGGGGGRSHVITTGDEKLGSDVFRYKSNRCTGESKTNITGLNTTMMSKDAHRNDTSTIGLGLKLTKSKELLTCIESALVRNTNNSKEKEKTKASNIPTLSLTIGKYKVKSKGDGHLITKCYFAKRKLVWEILEETLKRKIEMSWSDVGGIRADLPSGTLEVELNQPPSFALELSPTPLKHTQWEETIDFTNGHASLYRIHVLKFSLGFLDKHYEKLLEYDQRILRLSRSCFPTDMSPKFNTNIVHASRFPLPSVPRLLHPHNTTLMLPPPPPPPMTTSMLPPLTPMLPEAFLTAPVTSFGCPYTHGSMSVDVISEVPESENLLPGGWVDNKHNNMYNYNDVSCSHSTGSMMSDLYRICEGAMTMQNRETKCESMPGNTNYSPDFNNNAMVTNIPQVRMMP